MKISITTIAILLILGSLGCGKRCSSGHASQDELHAQAIVTGLRMYMISNNMQLPDDIKSAHGIYIPTAVNLNDWRLYKGTNQLTTNCCSGFLITKKTLSSDGKNIIIRCDGIITKEQPGD